MTLTAVHVPADEQVCHYTMALLRLSYTMFMAWGHGASSILYYATASMSNLHPIISARVSLMSQPSSFWVFRAAICFPLPCSTGIRMLGLLSAILQTMCCFDSAALACYNTGDFAVASQWSLMLSCWCHIVDGENLHQGPTDDAASRGETFIYMYIYFFKYF